MRILATWVGLADLFSSEKDDPSDLGPIGSALMALEFDRVMLLSDQPDARISAYVEWLGTIAPGPRLDPEHVDLSSPSAFSEVFAGVISAIDRRLPEFEQADEILFYLSPGTPVMAATWLILGKTRYHRLSVNYLESSRMTVNRLEAPFDLAANILPDVLRVADEEVAARTEGRVPPDAGFEEIIHKSPEMRRLIDKAMKAAKRSLTVLIEGGSGTGKELLAGAIHKASPFADKPFVAVNCGAIPENLIESELFGHAKGAFTGAVSARIGYLEAANGGTLFLDEIGELPLAAQVKLLRTLQQREIVPVGATKAKPVEFRVIAATNRDLAQEVAEGRFRADLYYRLCVIKLTLPPLRDRAGDLSLLIDRLLETINSEGKEELGYEARILSEGARARLLRHEWPGNVRELQNALARAAFLSDRPVLDETDVEDALMPATTGSSGRDRILDRPLGGDFDLKSLQAEVARHYMRRALKLSGNRISEAARLLGTSRQNFSNWMREHGVDLAENDR